MPGGFLAKMDVKMMISLNLIMAEEALATIDGAFIPIVDVLHGVPSLNNNIISSRTSADDSNTRNAEMEMRGKSSGTQSNTSNLCQ